MNDVSKEFYENIKNITSQEQKILLIEEFGAKLSSAIISNIWFCGDKNLFNIKNNLKIENVGGIINEVRKLKKPIFFNQAIDNPSYNEKMDNPNNVKIKDILYFPIIDLDGEIIAIFQAIITKGYFYQFIQKDLEDLSNFITFILGILKNIDYSEFFKKEKPINLKLDEPKIDRNIEKFLTQKIESLFLELNVAKTEKYYLTELIFNLQPSLHSISGYTNSIKNRIDKDNENYKDIENIIKNSYYLERQIDDILNLRKKDNQVFEVKKTKFSLLNLHEELIEMFMVEVDNKGITFVSFFDINTPHILSDERKLRQILIKLLKDSIQRVPKFGKIEFNINYQKNENIIFNVIDNGDKISSDEIKFLSTNKKIKNDKKMNKSFVKKILFINKNLALLNSTLDIDSDEKTTNFSFIISCKDNNRPSILSNQKCKDAKVGIFLPDISSYVSYNRELLIKYLKNFAVNNIEIFNSVDKIKDITHLFYANKLIDDTKLKKFLQDEIKIMVLPKRIISIENIKTIKNINKSYIHFKSSEIYKFLSNIRNPKGKKNILIIDGNITNLNLIKNSLERLNAIVQTGKDGEDAINLFVDSVVNHEKIDMIFFNKDIEKQDGVDCATEIIELSQKYGIDKIFIVIITSFCSELEMEKIKNIEGIDEVIKKPISYDIIKKLFNKLNSK